MKVNTVPYVNEMDEYLKADDVIDYRNMSIMKLADELFQNSNDGFRYKDNALNFQGTYEQMTHINVSFVGILISSRYVKS